MHKETMNMKRIQLLSQLAVFLWIFGGFELLVQGRVDGLTLAIGVWDLTISSNQQDFLFPSLNPQELKKQRRPWISKRPSRMECTLLLFPNRTFSIYPRSIDGNHPSDVLNMNGIWQWKNSPYCATDRFYDTVQLESFPRRAMEAPNSHKNLTISKNTAISNQVGMVLERGSFVLHSRLYGHYARRRRRRRRPHEPNQGTSTHGPPKSTNTRLVRGVCLWKADMKNFCNNGAEDASEKDHNSIEKHQNDNASPQGQSWQQRIRGAWKTWQQHQHPVVATFVARKRPLTMTGDD